MQREKTSAELRAERRGRGEGLEVRRRNAGRLVREGCIATIATDNYLGSVPKFRRTPKAENREAGIGTIIAIEDMVELGKTPTQAIVAGHQERGDCVQDGERTRHGRSGGTRRPPRLDANPLEDISNIRQLDTVLRNGRIVDLAALPYERILSRAPGT